MVMSKNSAAAARTGLRTPSVTTILLFLTTGAAISAPAPVWSQDSPPVTTPPSTPIALPPGAASGQNAAEAPDGPIRSGDAILVQVSGEPTLSGPQRVSAGGTITLPLLGSIKVAGQIPGASAETISSLLKKKNLLRNPQVIVTILGRPVRTISIAGAVEKQGRLLLTDNTHLDEVLEPAGITAASDLSRIVITRGEKKITVDYLTYRSGNDAPDGTNNPLLEEGDKIYVRARIQVAGTIKVNGEVKNPLTIGFTAGMTTVQAIQQAGGVTDQADREKVVVLREGKEIPIPLKLIQEGQTDRDITLQDKDEVFVRRLEKPKLFTVNGGVVRGNSYPLVGRVTLSDAIATAGGLLDRADRKKITLERKDTAGAVTIQTYDLNKMADASTVIRPEDVIAAPYPPERDPLGLLSAFSSLFFLFRR